MIEGPNDSAQEPAANGTGNDSRSVPGIFVYAQPRDNGDIAVAFECVGGFDVLAAPILLEIATKAVRHQLGLTD